MCASENVFAQGIVERRIGQERRDQHSRKAGAEHRQEHRDIRRHLGDEHDAGQGARTTPVKKAAMPTTANPSG